MFRVFCAVTTQKSLLSKSRFSRCRLFNFKVAALSTMQGSNAHNYRAIIAFKLKDKKNFRPKNV